MLSLEEMTEQFKPLIYKYALRLPPNAREDAIQNGYLAIARKFNDYRPELGAPSTFFLPIIRKAVWFNQGLYRDWIRKEEAVTNSLEEMMEKGFDIPVYDNEVKFQSRFERAIGALLEREKLVIRAIYFDDFSMTQVAKMLGVSKQRVSQIHASAIKKMHGIIMEGY